MNLVIEGYIFGIESAIEKTKLDEDYKLSLGFFGFQPGVHQTITEYKVHLIELSSKKDKKKIFNNWLDKVVRLSIDGLVIEQGYINPIGNIEHQFDFCIIVPITTKYKFFQQG